MGGSTLSAIRPEELQAAAGRLRKAAPDGGAGAGSATGAADVPTAPLPAAGGPREALLGAIKSRTFQLRPVGERPPLAAAPAPGGLCGRGLSGARPASPIPSHPAGPPPPTCAGPDDPLGKQTAGMAELLRRMVERRRVDADGASDSSDSDWEGLTAGLAVPPCSSAQCLRFLFVWMVVQARHGAASHPRRDDCGRATAGSS